MLTQVLGVTQAGLSTGTIEELIREQRPESQWLEFKSEYPKREDNGHREFARDVTAMANSAGGLLIYGVKEENDHAAASTPVPLGRETSGLMKALGSIVYPHLSSLQQHELPIGNSGSGYWILEIRRAPLRPYLVSEGSTFSCWRRFEKQRVPLNEAEIERAYFERMHDKSERESEARSFRDLASKRAGMGAFWFSAQPLEQQGRIWATANEGRGTMQTLLNVPSAVSICDRVFEGDLRTKFRRIEYAKSWESKTLDRFGWGQIDDRGSFFRLRARPKTIKPVGRR